MEQNIIYLDTEFIQNGTSVELISIGLVKMNGESYYAISSEFRPELASDWVRENVLTALENTIAPKPLSQIAVEITDFVGRQVAEFWGYLCMYDWWIILQMYGGNFQKMPYNLPIYCKELMQEIERLRFPSESLPPRPVVHHALLDAYWGRQVGILLKNSVKS